MGRVSAELGAKVYLDANIIIAAASIRAKGELTMATDHLQETIKRIQLLSFEEQLRLIKYLADRLAASAQPKTEARGESRYLEYGKYRNSGVGRMSTEEDFKLAEWNPTEEELNEY